MDKDNATISEHSYFTGGPIFASGALTVHDADTSDWVTPSVIGVVVDDPTHTVTQANVLGMLSVPTYPLYEGDHTFNWSFIANSGLFDHLAAGQNITLTYSVEVNDGNGGTALTPITVTITGAAENPVVSTLLGDTHEVAISEDGGAPGAPPPEMTPPTISTSGTLTVSDPEQAGPMTAQVTGVFNMSGPSANGPSYYETLSWLSVSVDPTKADHNLTWSWNANSNALDYLGMNDNAYLSYQVAVTTADGRTTYTNVDVLVTGVNDPVSRYLQDGSIDTVTVDETAPTASGTLIFYDPDGPFFLADLASPTVTVDGSRGTLTDAELTNLANRTVQQTAPDGTTEVDWTFNADPSLFAYLQAGEQVTINYNLHIWDGFDPGFTQSFSVTVVGVADFA